MTKPMTNKQLIRKLTVDSIDEVFVICAVEYYAKAVLEDEGKSFMNNSLINYHLWKVCANQALETIEGRSVVK